MHGGVFRMQHQVIHVGCVEVKNARLVMIYPDNGVKMIRAHGKIPHFCGLSVQRAEQR
jgi:hypothetical protein